MVGHVVPRRHHLVKREDPVSAPEVTGIDGAALTVATTMGTTVSSLYWDSSMTSSVGSFSAPPLAPTTPTTFPPTPTSLTLPQQSSSSPQPSAESNASSPIPMSTVIGSCVGALIGAVALIILGLWFYRRYSRSLKKYSRSRGLLKSHSSDRNSHRSRSRHEPWSKLEEEADKWEGMNKSKESEADGVAPMEKLTMFKKSPSVRTAYTHKSDEHPTTFDLPHPFSQYHATLAQEMASNETPSVPVPRPFLARVDTGPDISWDSRLMSDGTYLTLRSPRLSRGAMSPTPNMAIPTPAATTANTHRWESAEVVGFDERQSTDIVDSENPFEQDRVERRKSYKNNPFFNAQDFTPSEHSRSRSNSTTKSAIKSSKGKDRMLPENPFIDSHTSSFSPPFANHNVNDSLSSISSNDRAIQSLIAVLDISEEEVQARLRVASLQPSFFSATSASTEDEDVTSDFPLPPSVNRNRPEKKQQ